MKYVKQYSNFINEKLTNVNYKDSHIIDGVEIKDDVTLLYNLFFKKDIDKLNYTKILDNNMFSTHEIDTSILKSDICKEAHLLNPCKIKINIPSGRINNYYNFEERVIGISVNKNALEHIKDNDNNLDSARNFLYSFNSKKNFSLEFSEVKMRGSIHHELAHWVDDTFNNSSVKKFIIKRNKMDISKRKDVNISYIEIQAIIHNIYQLKLEYEDIWDILSFEDLIDLSTVLNTVYNNLKFDEREVWVKNIKKRMIREGLFGNNMNK